MVNDRLVDFVDVLPVSGCDLMRRVEVRIDDERVGVDALLLLSFDAEALHLKGGR